MHSRITHTTTRKDTTRQPHCSRPNPNPNPRHRPPEDDRSGFSSGRNDRKRFNKNHYANLINITRYYTTTKTTTTTTTAAPKTESEEETEGKRTQPKPIRVG